MLNSTSISLVIPCKNEASSLPKMLKRVPSFVDEVLVIDNNSSDDTAIIASKFGAKVISEKRTDPKGIGYGYAHQTGLKASKSDLIITMDGDGTYPIEQLKTVINYMLKNELDFVSCNRFPLKNSKAVSHIRKLGVFVLNAEVSVLFNHPIKDILSGMWIVDKKAVKKLQLQEGGWNLSPEIKLKALIHKDITFDEFHIKHHYRSHGASKQQIWNTGFDHLFYILKFKYLMIKAELQKVFQKKVESLQQRFATIIPITNLE